MSDSPQNQEMMTFGRALHDGDIAAVRGALEASEFVRTHIDDPVFDFGQRALHVAATNIPMLDLLLG